MKISSLWKRRKKGLAQMYRLLCDSASEPRESHWNVGHSVRKVGVSESKMTVQYSRQ